MSDDEYTVFCRNLAEEVTEPILYELFLQAGPVEDVRIPMQDGRNRSYGFIVFKHKCSVRYAIDLFRETKLYGKYITLQNRTLDAEREVEMRNRMMTRINGGYGGDMESLRGGPPLKRFNDMNVLRGGPPSNFYRNEDINVLRSGGHHTNFSRNDDLNVLRGGPPSSFSRNDDMNALRGGSMYSRMDSMSPRGFSNNSSRQSSKSDSKSSNFDPRLMNPYGSSLNSFLSESDSRGSQSNDWKNNRSYFDRSNTNDLRNILNNSSKRSEYERNDSRHGHDYVRRDRNDRPDKEHSRSRSNSRHRRRSRSKERSPQRYDRYRNR